MSTVPGSRPSPHTHSTIDAWSVPITPSAPGAGPHTHETRSPDRTVRSRPVTKRAATRPVIRACACLFDVQARLLERSNAEGIVIVDSGEAES